MTISPPKTPKFARRPLDRFGLPLILSLAVAAIVMLLPTILGAFTPHDAPPAQTESAIHLTDVMGAILAASATFLSILKILDGMGLRAAHKASALEIAQTEQANAQADLAEITAAIEMRKLVREQTKDLGDMRREVAAANAKLDAQSIEITRLGASVALLTTQRLHDAATLADMTAQRDAQSALSRTYLIRGDTLEDALEQIRLIPRLPKRARDLVDSALSDQRHLRNEERIGATPETVADPPKAA